MEVLKKQSKSVLVQAIHLKQRHKNIFNLYCGRKSPLIGGTCTSTYSRECTNRGGGLSFHLSFCVCVSPWAQIWIYSGAWILDQFSSTPQSKRARGTWRIIKRSARRGNCVSANGCRTTLKWIWINDVIGHLSVSTLLLCVVNVISMSARCPPILPQ